MSGERFVWTMYPTLGQRQKAGALALLMICGCMLALPLVGMQVPRFGAFIIIVDTALTLTALIVAALLYSQFTVIRAPALLVLACGFLLLSIARLPQLLRATQGDSADLGLEFIADAAIPVAAIAYALLRRNGVAAVEPGHVRSILVGGVIATVAFAAVVTWLTAPGEDALVTAGSASLLWRALATTLLCASLGVAIALLWRRRGTLLDLWLLVALTAWLIDVLLRGIAPDEGSFTWHFARLYGLLGVVCMMMALLAENATLHSRLIRMLTMRKAVRHQVRESAGTAARASLDALSDEINQPLCAITANADAITRMLASKAPDLADARVALTDIVTDALRASEILRAAQRLRADAGESAAVDVGQLVDECLVHLRSELREQHVSCEVQTADQLPCVRGSRTQLVQMMVYLVSHALEAVCAGPGHERRLRFRTSRHDERAVAISVADCGGLSWKFGPRFALCRSIVDAHGGHISVTPGEGGGAEFRVVLPASS